MVRASRVLFLKDGGNIGKVLSDFLVCPLSKQPLRHCQDSQSLISDAIGVSFPIIDGIPCLVPKDGKLLEDQDKSKLENGADSSVVHSERNIDDTSIALMSYFIAFMSYVLSLKNRVSGDAFLLSRGPVFPLEGGKLKTANDGEGECCVCLSRLNEEDVMRRLPCGHLFHRECVDRWLAMCRRTCPLCRLSVGGVFEGGMDEQFTEELMIWLSTFHVPGF